MLIVSVGKAPTVFSLPKLGTIGTVLGLVPGLSYQDGSRTAAKLIDCKALR